MAMSEKGINILNYKQDRKSLNNPFVIYAEVESLLEKNHTCDNNLEEFPKSKIGKHTA